MSQVAVTSVLADMEHPRPVDAASAPADEHQPGHSSDPSTVPEPVTFTVANEETVETPDDAADEMLGMSPEAHPGPSGLGPVAHPGSRAIGPYCAQAGITQDHFTEDDTLDLPVQDSLKKGLVLELNRYLTKTLKYSTRQVVDVLAMLAGSADGQHFDGLDDNPSSNAPTLERRKWKFSLSPEEQGMIWVYKGRHNNSLKGHIGIFAQKVSEVNPYCVLVFKFNRVKKFGSRKKRAPFFHGKAVCKFHGCTQYDFVIKKTQVAGEDLQVKVKVTGDIIHGKDFQHLRLVIGDANRNNKSKKAKLNLKQLMTEESCPVGDQNGIPSTPSSVNQPNLVDMDAIKELLKVKDKTEDMGSIGYVQYLSLKPFGLIVFTDAQLKILIEKIKDELVTLHLGATGSLVKEVPNQSNGLQYCALVVSGHGNDPPLPLAEFISYVHTYPELDNFLMRFGYAIEQLDERYSVPGKVIVDCRWDLIQAVNLSFNHAGTRSYLQNVWDGCPPACKVYICSGHLMHVVSRRLVETEKNLKRFILQCVARMIDTSSRDEVDNIFSLMCKVLLSKVPPRAETMQQLGSEVTFEYDEQEDYNNTTFLEESDDCSWLTSSPYYKHYQSIKITNESNKWNRCTDKNPYHAPEFVRYFLQTFMSIAPLWTGIVDATPPATNATLKDWFRTVKTEILQEKKRLRLGQIIQSMADSLHGRIRKYQLASLSNALKRPQFDEERNQQARQKGKQLCNSMEQNTQPQAETRATSARRNKAKRQKKD